MPPARRTESDKEAPSPEAFLAAYEPRVRELAQGLRRLVAASVPGAIERVAVGWQLIGYRVPDGRRSRYFCFIAPLADSVRLGFEYGVQLGGQAALEGDGTQVRYVTVRALVEIDAGRLAPLVAEAAMVALARGRG